MHYKLTGKTIAGDESYEGNKSLCEKITNEVVEGLKAVGVKVMSIIPVERIGAFVDPLASGLALDRTRYHSTVFKLEIVCRKEDTNLIVEVLRNIAHTGAQGDGAIFISSVERTIKIRSGSEGVITLDSHVSSSGMEAD